MWGNIVVTCSTTGILYDFNWGLRRKSSKQQRTVLVDEYKHISKGTESTRMLTTEKRKSKRMKTKEASLSYTMSHLMMTENELYKDYTWKNSTWTLQIKP